jgi:hypothetical protein
VAPFGMSLPSRTCKNGLCCFCPGLIWIRSLCTLALGGPAPTATLQLQLGPTLLTRAAKGRSFIFEDLSRVGEEALTEWAEGVGWTHCNG